MWISETAAPPPTKMLVWKIRSSTEVKEKMRYILWWYVDYFMVIIAMVGLMIVFGITTLGVGCNEVWMKLIRMMWSFFFTFHLQISLSHNSFSVFIISLSHISPISPLDPPQVLLANEVFDSGWVHDFDLVFQRWIFQRNGGGFQNLLLLMACGSGVWYLDVID